MARTLGDGAWCWFGDPRALYFEDRHRKTYVGWVDRGGDLTVASFDHRARHVERAVLKRGLSVDDHNSPGLLMRANGHLTVYYMGVDRKKMHYRRASDPEDITNFGPEHDLPTNTPGRRGYTYPNPIYLSEEGRVYLFWRGAQWWPAFSRHSDGNPWRPARTIMKISGQRPYLKFASDGKGVIDIAYTEGNAGSFVNSIYYLRYRAGAFRKTDGTRVARVGELPIRPSDGERVYDARATGVRAWVWDIALRADGTPVIVYALFPDRGQNCSYERAEYTGSEWVRHTIVEGGGRIGDNYAPGISLDHENPDVAYLSRKVDGRYIVERWRTEDRGATWTHRKVNTGSGGDCLRPISPRGRRTEDDVLWMQGEYRDYTDYRTNIRGHFSTTP